MIRVLRLGTRGSTLALIQANKVKSALEKAHAQVSIVIVPISTQGDDDKETPLAEIGGKGVFIKTIEQALIDETIDIAVHSLKDMTSEMPESLILSSFLKPEAVEDALIVNDIHLGKTLMTLPKGARIGTSSMRRKALLKQLRPDVVSADLRGNVDTRLKKCADRQFDAVLLSKAGLLRMEYKRKIAETLDPNTFVISPGQGVIVLQTRKNDMQAQTLATLINDEKQESLSRLELDILYTLGLDCRFPFGCYTVCDEGRYEMTLFWADLELKYRKKETIHFLESEKKSVINEITKKIKADLDRWQTE
jgi:hydroxymethylbilane synthase